MQRIDLNFMMDKDATPLETLKEILQQARTPDALDDHPWTQGLFVAEALAADPGLARARGDTRLLAAHPACRARRTDPSPTRLRRAG